MKSENMRKICVGLLKDRGHKASECLQRAKIMDTSMRERADAVRPGGGWRELEKRREVEGGKEAEGGERRLRVENLTPLPCLPASLSVLQVKYQYIHDSDPAFVSPALFLSTPPLLISLCPIHLPKPVQNRATRHPRCCPGPRPALLPPPGSRWDVGILVLLQQQAVRCFMR